VNKSAAGGSAFIVVGVAFIAIGSGGSGQRAFLPIGLAFFATGISFVVRGRRERPVKR